MNTRHLKIGHVVKLDGDDDDWAVIELVPLAMGGIAVYLRNADGVESRRLIAEEFMDSPVWNVVAQPDDDRFND